MLKPESVKQFNKLLVEFYDTPNLILFLSDDIEESKKFEETIESLTSDVEDVEVSLFIIKDSTFEFKELFKKYDVQQVPCLVILNTNFQALKTMTDFSPADIIVEVQNQENVLETNQKLEQQKYQKIFGKYLTNNQIVLFDFSQEFNDQYNKIVSFLNERNLAYKILDKKSCYEDNPLAILPQLGLYLFDEHSQNTDDYPVLYFNKNLISNLEQLSKFYQIHEDLFEQLKKTEENRFKKLLKQCPIVLLIDKSQQNTEQQQKLQQEMEQSKIIFTYLDINERQNLIPLVKELSKKENLKFPMVKNEKDEYFDCDDLQNKKLTEIISKDYFADDVDSLIKYLIDSQRIFVFIKGTPDYPQCKFSRQLIEFLNSKGVENFGFFNILTNNELRERLKVYSNWKTYPQVYVGGKLVGGNDVLLQMDALGQLDELFQVKETEKDN